MWSALHEAFGSFQFSFEATSQKNEYTIKKYAKNALFLFPRFPETVLFESHDKPKRYDLPSPELLEVHAVIARILHASGATENIEKVLRDIGE